MEQDSIIEKLKSAICDMDAHSYNNYTDDSEYLMYLSVKEINWLLEHLINCDKD